MSVAKQIKTLCFQLRAFVGENVDFQQKATIIENEFLLCEDSCKVITDVKRAQLNRVLHSTRAFDSGLRLFIEKHGRLNPNIHSIGQYVIKLQKNLAGQKFRQLSGTDATNINNMITNERNKYMHAAGQFPTKAQADVIVGKILDYYQRILGLEIT